MGFSFLSEIGTHWNRKDFFNYDSKKNHKLEQFKAIVILFIKV